MLTALLTRGIALPAILLAIASSCLAQPTTLLIEAESFQLHGDWLMENLHSCSGRALLKVANGAQGDAVTVIDVPTPGTYRVWARAMDFPNAQPGARRYTVMIDGQRFDQEAGDHGQNGWYWETMGKRELGAGEHLLALRDVTHFYGRCDAVLLTTDDTDPNQVSLNHLAAFRIDPEDAPIEKTQRFPQAANVAVDGIKQVAELDNGLVRVAFSAGKDASGKPRVVRAMQAYDGERWIDMSLDPNQESLFLLYSPKSGVNLHSAFPSWADSKEQVAIRVGQTMYQTSAGQKNPFWAGTPTLLVPRAAQQIDGQRVQVHYESDEGLAANGVWELGVGRRDLRLQLSTVAEQAGDYSFGFTAFNALEADDVKCNMLLPLFQYQRRPLAVSMVTSSLTPHPMVLVQPEPEDGRGQVTWMLAADMHRLPYDWPDADNGKYGFALLNPDEKVQPSIFNPVLGGVGSTMDNGQTLSASWHLLAMPGDWKEALAYESSTLMGVTDYRRPTEASLSDAANNMIALLKDDFASGWDAELKGFYNIETISVVTQAAPLAVLEAALLTQDEDLYVARALPTLEYLLTRPSAHFAVEVPDTEAPYVTKNGIKLSLVSDFYGTALWQGFDELLGSANPWLADLAFEKGDVRYRKTYSGMPKWSELLAAYRLDPTPQRLEQVRAVADLWIDNEVFGRHDNYLGMRPFYNMSFYPYWWDLVDLYEITGDPRHLDAALEGAYHTVAGQWVHPMYTDEVAIHPDGHFVGNDHMWWRGDEVYRLGYPRQPNDTPAKTVPGWVVSNIGLGLEQPSTYFGGATGNFQNIMMSSWAPHLLRLYQLTGDETLRTFARNTIIGRFANYPGYYLRGFSDHMQSTRYPYDGPDVTSVYYHHIPPQLAFTLDYLVTDVRQRSDNTIHFPWAKQQGYVWFTNRIYGGKPGRVFDDDNVALRLDHEAASVDTIDVNVLLGRGEDHVYVMLTNDAPEDVTATLSLDAQRLGLIGSGSAQVMDARGQVIDERPLAASMQVDVPVRGLVVVSLPARHKTIGAPLPPVRDGRVDRKMPDAWQQMHAFRIRSPFGKDSLYVVLMGRPAEGSVAELAVVHNGEEIVLRDATYPYEFSLYPWAMSDDIRFGLTLYTPDGERILSEAFALPGSPTAASTAAHAGD